MVSRSRGQPGLPPAEYFMAMIFKGLGLAYLTDEKTVRRPRAGDVPLIRAVREGRTSYLHPVEVARDPSPLDRWSIVRLDWDFSPFLRPLEGGEFVDSPFPRPRRGRDRCDGSEPKASALIPPLPAAPGEFELPPLFAGTVRAEVQPATATKARPGTSRLLRIGSADACRERSASPN